MQSFIYAIKRLNISDNSTICLACRFDIEDYQDALFDKFNIHFPNILSRAVPKRKAEFLAGRYLAQQAMKNLGLAIVDVPIGTHRAPQWSKGVYGTISHSGNRAFCLLSLTSKGVGLDYEEEIADKTAKEIQNSIIDSQEAELCRFCEYDFNRALTLVFSAKESLFKALYPSVNRYFDFLDAAVIAFNDSSNINFLDNSSALASLTLALKTNLNDKLVQGQRFKVFYQWQDDGVLTVTGVKNIAD